MLPKPRWRPAPSWIYFRWLFWTHLMPCFNHWSQPSFRICCASIHHRTVLACHLLTVITGQFLPVNQWSLVSSCLSINGQFLPVTYWQSSLVSSCLSINGQFLPVTYWQSSLVSSCLSINGQFLPVTYWQSSLVSSCLSPTDSHHWSVLVCQSLVSSCLSINGQFLPVTYWQLSLVTAQRLSQFQASWKVMELKKRIFQAGMSWKMTVFM